LQKEVPLSTKVYNKDGKTIGKVARIFGPVKQPYAAIDGKGDSAMEIYVR
jgi:Gar1/Naf1 RNA binding region.